jgi:hypothetical protein
MSDNFDFNMFTFQALPHREDDFEFCSPVDLGVDTRNNLETRAMIVTDRSLALVVPYDSDFDPIENPELCDRVLEKIDSYNHGLLNKYPVHEYGLFLKTSKLTINNNAICELCFPAGGCVRCSHFIDNKRGCVTKYDRPNILEHNGQYYNLTYFERVEYYGGKIDRVEVVGEICIFTFSYPRRGSVFYGLGYLQCLDDKLYSSPLGHLANDLVNSDTDDD